jgi:hypothetical protein
MITNTQKESLIYSAIGQVIVIIGLIIFALYYILPGFQKIQENKDLAQSAYDSYITLKKEGIPYDVLVSTLAAMSERDDLRKIIQSAPEETKKILVSSGSSDYISWLQDNIWKTEWEKKSLKQAKQKINSIIPTMSPVSTYSDEDNITLKEYIQFIENNILKAFNIDTNMALGIQWVAYGDSQSKMPKNIWSFTLNLDFNSTNENIEKLIEFIQKSGNPKLLLNTGALADDDAPSAMSNPLITLESFSLQNTLDMDNPSNQNSWRMTIRFYIRGSSLDDVAFLKQNLKSRREKLEKDINTSIESCKKNAAICSQLSRLEQVRTKFLEFTRSIDSRSALVSPADEIYVITGQLSSLKMIEKEFAVLAPSDLQK